MLRAVFTSLVLVGLAVGHPQQEPPLFPTGGPRAAAVRQGTLGSCYFHATIAALADADPQSLARRIEPAEGAWVVHFTSGPDERVEAADVEYARAQGFDQSDGVWVSALLRAYAQRLLRTSLQQAVGNAVTNPLMRQQVEQWIGGSDTVLNAYDRAIRAVVDQSGGLSPALLQGEFHRQLGLTPLPAIARAGVEDALVTHGVFASVAAMVQQNGEIFGAYRAAGNGGLPLPVMQAFRGPAREYRHLSAGEAALQLASARLRREAAVAATGEATFDELRRSGMALPADAGGWFVAGHAYTVLGFNGASVTLRNPWGRHPDPDGVFQVSLPAFVAIFPELFVQSGCQLPVGGCQ